MKKIKELWAKIPKKKAAALLGALVLSICLYVTAKDISQKVALQQEATRQDTIVEAQAAPKAIAAPIPAPAQEPKKLQVVTLSKKNTITFRGVVTDENVAKLERDLLKLSQNLSPSDPIYLVMNTPGGSIDAGNEFITFVRGLPQKVHTITLFSASMGFHIVQNLDDRMVAPNGVLMSHRARASGLSGEMPGSMVTRLNFYLRQLKAMDQKVAERVSMKLEDYQELIRDEYWVSGQESVDAKMADRMVLPRCGKDMSGINYMEIMTFFGPIRVSFSECPLITGPLSIEFGGAKFKTEDERREVARFIRKMIEDPESFVEEYIVNDQYKKYLTD